MVLKNRQVQNEVTCAKSIPSNQELMPNLITVSNSLRNGVLNQSIWTYLVSTSETM